MHFGNWDDNIHEDPEQIKRIEKSKKSDLKPLAIDEEKQICLIQGSGKEPYQVTLDSCTCSDFTRRKLPCKHIYRLANELGLGAEQFQSGINKKELNDLMFTLPVDIQEIFYDLLYGICYYNKKQFIFSKELDLMPLIVNGFFIENVDSFYPAAEQSNPGYLREMLETVGLAEFKKGTHLKTILKWFKEAEENNIEALKKNLTVLEITPEAWNLRHSIKRRFESRFEKRETEYYSETVKHFIQDK